jgi:hypothetical protein
LDYTGFHPVCQQQNAPNQTELGKKILWYKNWILFGLLLWQIKCNKLVKNILTSQNLSGTIIHDNGIKYKLTFGNSSCMIYPTAGD